MWSRHRHTGNWGLRDYGIEPSIWDENGECEHVWGIMEGKKITQWADGVGMKDDALADPVKRKEKRISQEPSQGQFCQLCGAWRGCLGLEPQPELYVKHLVDIFREIKRVLRKDGTVWLNLGDSYAGSCQGFGTKQMTPKQASNKGTIPLTQKQSLLKDVPGLKPKDLVGIPWSVALALRDDGWWLRRDIIWSKPNPMPESVTDRPTTAHEYIFLLIKSKTYYYDAYAVREKSIEVKDYSKTHKIGNKRNPTNMISGLRPRTKPAIYEYKNLRSVWEMPTQPFPQSHFAVFTEKIPEICIKAGTSEKGRCPKCGNLWKRVTEKKGLTSREWQKIRGLGTKGNDPMMGIQGKSIAGARPPDPINKTIGWRPACNCGLEPEPCIVLDPFCGAGTTLKVARKLGRKSIGIDIKKEYCDMTIPRINQQILGV